MAPPSFADLGKAARDLFNKGYNIGYLKLDTTTRAGLLELRTGSSHNHQSQKFFGSIDLKYKIKEYGLTVTERWNTDNTLGSEVIFDDKRLKGVKLTLDTTFAPNTGKRSGKIRSEYQADNVHINTDVSLNKSPVITTGIVGGHRGWLGGLQFAYDSSQNKVSTNTVALGYRTPDYTLHTFVRDSTEFGGSVYHIVTDRIELGVNFGWTQGSDDPARYGVAALYEIDRDSLIRARISSASNVALAYTFRLKEGLKATVSGVLNLQNLVEGGAKFGFGLEFDV